MPKKKPSCTIVAGDALEAPGHSVLILIALIFSFEAYLISVGLDPATSAALVVSGVATASLVTTRSSGRPIKLITALMDVLSTTVAR